MTQHESDMKSFNDKMKKFDEFEKIWLENLEKYIHDFITMGKNCCINLPALKEMVIGSTNDILEYYHEKERYHEIEVDRENDIQKNL